MTVSAPTVVEYARRYAAAGFRVFPLHGIRDGRCTCGDADCRSAGKHPRTPHGVRDATADAAAIDGLFAAWPDSNIGMAMGAGIAALDIDPRNGGDVTLAAALDKHGPLPDTATALTGGGGTHYLFRTPPGGRLPGKLGKGIDIKGEGGYIVVEPSIHASGHAYSWEASSDPLEGQQIAPLPAWITLQPATTPVPERASGIIPEAQALELRSALSYLDADDRDIWTRVGMALHSTGASNAFGMWTEWSQLSAKFDAKDQRRVWMSFRDRPDGIHLETIFVLATQAGWANPASKAAASYSEAVQKAIEEANGRTRIEPFEPPEPADTGAIPVPVLEDLAQWIDRRYAVTHPAVTRQAVLTIAALGSSRIYVGDGNTPANLCLGVAAESALLCTYARDAVSTVLADAGLRRMFRGTRCNAPSNVYGMLFRSPAAVHVVEDFGHLAQFAKRQPSGVLDQTFSVMANAYNAGAIYLDSAVEAGLKLNTTDDQLVVHSPALSTLLLSTTAQLGTLLQREEVARGLLAYQLAAIALAKDAREQTPSAEHVPATVIDTLRAVRRLPANRGDLSLQDIFGSQPCLKPQQVRVRMADMAEHRAAIDAISAEPEHRPIIMAAQETARRMAVALAPWADPGCPTAGREIVDWCTGYVLRLTREWLEQYSTLGNEDGKIDVAQKIVQTVTSRRSEGMRRCLLINFCRAYRRIMDKEKREAIVNLLIDDGQLVEYTPPGKRHKVLVAAKFARAKGIE